MNLLHSYLRVSLVKRVVAGLILGASIGGALWTFSVLFGLRGPIQTVMRYCSPFGMVFIGMLKMIVVPTVFFSLVNGASSLPLKKLGRVGGKIIGWYFATMSFAAVLGVSLACWINPGAGASLTGWQDLAKQFGAQAQCVISKEAPKTVADVLEKLLSDVFQNPFSALASGNFWALSSSRFCSASVSVW